MTWTEWLMIWSAVTGILAGAAFALGYWRGINRSRGWGEGYDEGWNNGYRYGYENGQDFGKTLGMIAAKYEDEARTAASGGNPVRAEISRNKQCPQCGLAPIEAAEAKGEDDEQRKSEDADGAAAAEDLPDDRAADEPLTAASGGNESGVRSAETSDLPMKGSRAD